MKHFLLLFSLFAIISCDNPKKEITQYETLYENQYAKRFEVLGTDDSVILRVHNPWQGASNVVFDYGFPKHTVSQPRIVCMSSSHIAYLDAIGAVGDVVGVSGTGFITNEKIKTARVPDVGYDNNLNYELLVSLKPDYVFIYEVLGENSATTRKLEQLGVKVIYIADYLEETPLARSEWIVAFGAIMGRIEHATMIFDDISSRYNKIKDSVSKIAAVKPTVMLNTPYRDVWYLPGDRSYMVQLINDAGGDYLGKGVDNDISRPISTELAYEFLRNADYWLNPSAAKTLSDIRNSDARFANLPAVTSGRVFNNNARSTPEGGSDFWESGTLRADRVLQDLAKILHPEHFKKGRMFYYHQLK